MYHCREKRTARLALLVRLPDPLHYHPAICPIATTASPFMRAKWIIESSFLPILITFPHSSNRKIGGFPIIWDLPADRDGLCEDDDY